MRNYTDEQMLQLLKDHYERTGKTPRRREIEGFNSIITRFGTWGNAVKMAGLTPIRRNWTKDEILKTIESFYEENGRYMTYLEVQKTEGVFSHQKFEKVLGMTYNKYLESLGAWKITKPDKVYLDMNDENLIKEFKKEVERIGSTFYRSFDQSRKEGFPSSDYFKTRFGSWNNTLKYAELDLNTRDLNKDEFTKWFLDKIKELGYVPSSTYFRENYTFFYANVKKYFKNYVSMCKELGLENSVASPTAVTHSNEELIQSYRNLYIKLGRTPTAKDINAEKGMYNYDVFLIRFGTIHNLRKLAGVPNLKQPKKIISKEDVEDDLKRIYREHGVVTMRELKNLTKYSISTIFRRFNTTKITEVWNEIQE